MGYSQEIYDAAKQSIGYCNTEEAVRDSIRDAFSNAYHIIECVGQEFSVAAQEMTRPSVLYRPRIYMDGNAWCALYGENLQDGVAGFGNSPIEAMTEFDKAWTQVRTPLERDK